ncbi:glycosyltransferase family 4 protein [Rhodococcus indonesiensis]
MREVAAAVPGAKIMVQCSPDTLVPDGVQRLPRMSHLEIRELYRRASVVVVPTRPNLHFSGMTVALEAMSTGRPVVVTDSPGASEYVRDGVDGFLAKSGDARAFARHTINILRNRDLGEALGRQGALAVEQRFTHQRLASSLGNFIEDLGNEPRHDVSFTETEIS